VRPILGRVPNEVKKGIKTVAHLALAACFGSFIRLFAEVTYFATDHRVFSGFQPSHGLLFPNPLYRRVADQPSGISRHSVEFVRAI